MFEHPYRRPGVWARAWAAVGRVLALGRTRPGDPYSRGGLLPLQVPASGVRIDYETAMQISAAWACITLIAKHLAASEQDVFTFDVQRRMIRMVDDPVGYLLNVRPAPDVTAFGWRCAMMIAVLSRGNGYSEIVRDRGGRVSQLRFLDPWRCTLRRRTEEEDPEMGLVLRYQQPAGAKSDYVELEYTDVLHWRGPGVVDVLGDSVVSRGVMALSNALAADKFAGAYFGNNSVLGGFLELDGTLSDTAEQRIQASWNSAHRGADNAFRVPVLEKGVRFNQLVTNAESTQLVQARTFSISDICRLWGVPPHMVQDVSRATFNNIEHQSLEYTRNCLGALKKPLEQECDYKLFSPRGQRRVTKIQVGWLAEGDSKTRAETNKLYFEMGAFSPNQVLEREGLNHIGPDGDIRVVPMNMCTLQQLQFAELRAQINLEIARKSLAAGSVDPGATATDAVDAAATDQSIVEPGVDARGPQGPQIWNRAGDPR